MLYLSSQSALKIGVKQKGCNGLTYTLDYAKEKGKFDEEVVQDGELLFSKHLQYSVDTMASNIVYPQRNMPFTF